MNKNHSEMTSCDYQRILLTGGGGFVGRYLAPLIAAAFPNAQYVLLRSPGTQEAGCEWTSKEADIIDGNAVDAIVHDFQPDLVLHLAAQASVAAALGQSELTWRVNFDGSLNLASACARHCPDLTFFFVSSAEVYGWSFRDGAVSEEAPLRPMTAYARSKAAAESMLPDVLPASARLIVARPFNHTGPGQDQRFVLPSIAAQIAAIEADQKPPRLEVGNLSAERDFLDVRDVCAAYLALLRYPHASGAREVYNVASGQSYQIQHLLEKLRARATKPFEIVIDPKRLRPSDISRAVGSSERLNAATGWQPVTSIDSLVDELLQYWRNNLRRSIEK